MRIAVTGVGGLLATALVPALEQTGHAVRALRRADADVTRLDVLRRALETVATPLDKARIFT